jgi:endonuclease/exonuclease/phosphatase (EEP) superfamily protein YafD
MTLVLRVVVALLGALTVLGFLGRFWWPLELASFFRPWFGALLVVAALLALPVRLFRLAAAALALAAADVAAVAVPDRPSYPPAVPGSRVELLLLNVWARNDDYGGVADLIGRERPDVVGLTELTPAWARALAPVLASFPSRALSPARGAFGIGLYSRVPLRGARLSRFAAGAPPAAVASLTLAGRAVTLVLAHPPFPVTPGNARARRRQLESIGHAFRRGELGSRVAVCGDLNSPAWSYAARRLMAAGLSDTAARLPRGTWPRWLPAPLRLPLDTCLLSNRLTLVSRSIGPNVGSDHLPLLIELGVAE